MAGYVSTFSADADSAEIAQALIRDGGVIIDELMPCEVLDAVRAEIDAAVSAEEQEGSSDLWPEADPRDRVCLDLWEPYLERA